MSLRKDKTSEKNKAFMRLALELANQSLLKLGTQKIKKNNILIVEINNLGVIKKKKLLDLNDMNDLKYLEISTEKEFKNDNLLYNVFTSLREKINAPAKNKGK